LGPLESILHLLSFAAPAFVVALLVTLASGWVLPRAGKGLGWRGRFALSFVAGVATLAIGLWAFGRDGKMATYAALVLVVATTQWLAGNGWRS
jgi:hypothetical protein